jgi:hypothetical protein
VRCTIAAEAAQQQYRRMGKHRGHAGKLSRLSCDVISSLAWAVKICVANVQRNKIIESRDSITHGVTARLRQRNA